MQIRHNAKFLLICTALLLTGCHKLEATTTVQPGGFGELRMAVGFSAEERANMEKQNGNSQDFCNTSQTPPNVKVTEEQRGEETWCITATQFKNLNELRDLYEQREGITINRLEISDGKFYYDVDIDTLSEGSSFAMLTEITWSIALPGAPISSNSDEVNGHTITWKLTPKSGVVNLRAESDAPRGFGFPPCISAVIGFGVAFTYLGQRRRKVFSP